MKDLICVRKSARKYLDEKISDDDLTLIKDFINEVKPLNDSISFSYDILTKDDVNLKTRWSAPYYLAIYSEKDENYMENIGFVFQQVSLFMQSIDIGSCWVGLGKPKAEKDNFIILMAFGKSNDKTRNLNEFKRKRMDEFADHKDDSLIPAYYAPSAVNSQPWYFTHTNDGFDVYQKQQNLLKRKLFGKWNPIDMGICLSHLYITYQNTFKFEIKEKYEKLDGYRYVGSISF